MKPLTVLEYYLRGFHRVVVQKPEARNQKRSAIGDWLQVSDPSTAGVQRGDEAGDHPANNLALLDQVVARRRSNALRDRQQAAEEFRFVDDQGQAMSAA